LKNFPCQSTNTSQLQKNVLGKRCFLGSILNDPFNRLLPFHFKIQLFPHLLSGISLDRCSIELLFTDHWKNLLISAFVHTNLFSYTCLSPRVSRSLLEIVNESMMSPVCFNHLLREKTCIKIHTVQRELNFRF